MKDSYLRACSCSNMRELERNIAAADKINSVWQLIQIKKLIARRQVLLAIDAQCRWARAGSDMNKAARQYVIAHAHLCLIDKPRPSVKVRDAGLLVSFLSVFRNRIGERSFEAHQRRPVYSRVRGGDTLSLHPSAPVDHICRADQYLFRIAAAQCAGSAKRMRVDDGYTPTG